MTDAYHGLPTPRTTLRDGYEVGRGPCRPKRRRPRLPPIRWRASMIGTATFVMLIAATAVADNAYPPCTQQRTDNCSAQQQAPGPTLYIPCPKGEYCPPHDIPPHKRQR